MVESQKVDQEQNKKAQSNSAEIAVYGLQIRLVIYFQDQIIDVSKSIKRLASSLRDTTSSETSDGYF